MKKIISVILGSSVILLIAVSISVLFFNFALSNEIVHLGQKKEKEFTEKIAREREVICRDLDEKYGTYLASFKALAKKMEIERKKVQDLQNELKSPKKDKESFKSQKNATH